MALCALLGATGSVAAQPQMPFEIVDPGLTDSSALGHSLRLVPVDLRTPSGFDRVFRLPTVTGVEMFARIDGGLTAVFPRSEYSFGHAVVPAGTVWYIGKLPASLTSGSGTPAEPRARSPQAMLQRVDLRAVPSEFPGARTTKRGPERNPVMPWAGELERGGRVAALLQRAARVNPPSTDS